MSPDPGRLFLWSGLVWHAAMRAYWVSLVIRITIDLGLTSFQLVLMGTVMELALLLAEVPTGVVADAISRKWSIVTGFVVVGGAQVAAGVVETVPLLIATQIVWGVGYTFRSGADVAWVTDELGGPHRVEGLILRRARLQQVVSVVSIAGGALLAWLTTLTMSITITGVVLLATGLVLAVTMPESRRPQTRPGPGFSPLGPLVDVLSAGLRVASSSPALRVLVAVVILLGLASEAVDRLDIRRLDQLGLSARFDEIVVVGAIATVEAVVGFAVLSATRNRVTGSTIPLALALVLASSAVGVALLGLVAVLPLAAVGLVVQGGLRQGIEPLTVTWANTHAPSPVRATVLSFIEQATSLGEIGGGLLLGAVAAATTVPTAMAASVVLFAVAVGVASTGASRWSPVPVTAPG